MCIRDRCVCVCVCVCVNVDFCLFRQNQASLEGIPGPVMCFPSQGWHFQDCCFPTLTGIPFSRRMGIPHWNAQHLKHSQLFPNTSQRTFCTATRCHSGPIDTCVWTELNWTANRLDQFRFDYIYWGKGLSQGVRFCYFSLLHPSIDLVKRGPVGSCFFVQRCFASAETLRNIRDVQDVHLDFHTAPELWAMF